MRILLPMLSLLFLGDAQSPAKVISQIGGNHFGHPTDLYQILVDESGTYIVTRSPSWTLQRSVICVWTTQGKLLHRWDCEKVVAMALSPNGHWLAHMHIHGNIILQELPSGRIVDRFGWTGQLHSYGGGPPSDLFFMSDNRHLIVSTGSGIERWDLLLGARVVSRFFLNNTIDRYFCDPTCQWLATFHAKKIQILNAKTLEPHAVLEAKAGQEQQQLDFSPLLGWFFVDAKFSTDGKTLGVLSDQGTLRQWSVNDKKFFHTQPWPDDQAKPPNLALRGHDQIIACQANAEQVKLVAMGSKKTVFSVRQDELGEAYEFRFLADGRHFATWAEEELHICRHDGKRVAKISFNRELRSTFLAATNGETVVALRRDPKKPDLDHHHLSAWSTNTGKITHSIPFTGEAKLLGISGNGQWVTMHRGDRIECWNINTGKHRALVQNTHHDDCVLPKLVGDAKGRLWAMTTPTGVQIMNRITGKKVYHLSIQEVVVPSDSRLSYNATALSILLSADGRYLIVYGDDRLWIVDTKVKKVHIHMKMAESIRQVAFSSDQRLLATFSFSNTLVLWDIQQARRLRSIGSIPEALTSLSFSSDDKTILGTSQTRLYFFDVLTEKSLGQFLIPKLPTVIERAILPAKSDHIVTLTKQLPMVLRFRRDFLKPAMTHSTVEPLPILPGKPMKAIQSGLNSAHSSDSRWRVKVTNDAQHLIELWNSNSETKVLELNHIRSSEIGSIQVCLSPMGQFLASQWRIRKNLSQTKGIFIHELASGRLVTKIPVYYLVGSMAFTPDRRYLVFTTLNPVESRHHIRFWDLFLNREVMSIALSSKKDVRLTISTKKNWLITEGPSGNIIRDLSSLQIRKPLQPVIWTQKQQHTLRADVLDAESPTAFQSLHALSLLPQSSLDWLKDQLKPVKVIDFKLLSTAVADLDHRRFTVRSSAFELLRKAGNQAIPSLKKKLRESPSVEVKRRIERLLKLCTELPMPRERVGLSRCLLLLQQLKSTGSLNLLKKLSNGASHAWLTKEAKAHLEIR